MIRAYGDRDTERFVAGEKVRRWEPFRRQAEKRLRILDAATSLGDLAARETMARTPIHPGEILGDELEEIGLSAKGLADLIKVPPNRLYQILAGKRNMTADTALRLARYFGMSADFWMNLQSAYELDLARQQLGKVIQRIPKRSNLPVEPRSAA